MTASDEAPVPASSETRVDVRVLQRSVEERLFGIAAPVRLGRFSILDKLGTGGMGSVYAAYDPDLDRRIAVKVLRSPVVGGDGTARLVREARALAKLAHPAVVTVHEVGVQDDQVFIAMELASGGTLATWTASIADDPDRFMKIAARMRECIEGLQAAHDAGLVHRDLKPANVLIAADGRAKIADFGLARIHELADASSTSQATEHAPDDDETAVKLPSTTAQVGTPAYMSPEHVAGRADERSDQFSLCATFFEMFYGQRPFGGRDPAQILARIADGVTVPVTPARDVPGWMFALLARGLCADPAGRFSSVKALGDALERGLRPRRRHWPIVGVGGIAAAAAAAVVWPRQPVLAVPTTSPCTDGREILAPVWGPDRLAAVRAAFESTGQPVWRGVWDRVRAPLDAWAEEWSAATLASCEATRVYATQTEHMLELRTICLDRQLEQVQQIVQEYLEVTPESIYEAHRGVTGIPRVQACAEPERLVFARGSYDLSSPVVQTFFRSLDDAELIARQGQPGEARQHLSKAASIAEEYDIALLAAVAHGRLSTTLLGLGELQDAEQAARRSLHFAERSGDGEAMVLAWYRLAKIAHETKESDHADFYVERAQNNAERLDVRQEVRADLLGLEAKRRMREGKHEEAARLHLQAARMIEELGIRSSAALQQRRAATLPLSLAGLVEEATDNGQRVVELSEALKGPTHPSTLIAKARLAEHYREIGEHAAALSLTSFVADNLPPPEGLAPRTRHALTSIHASVLQKNGRADEASRVLEASIAEASRELGETSRSALEIRSFYAQALLDQGRLDEALVQYASLEEACAKRSDGPCFTTNRGGMLLNYAQTLSELDRHAEALAKLGPALELLTESTGAASPRRFDTLLIAAKILVRAGRTRLARERLREGQEIANAVEVAPESLAELQALRATLEAP